MILKNTLRVGSLLRLTAGFVAFGLIASTAQSQTNLLTNPDFEAGCDPATGANAGFEVPIGYTAFNGGTCSTDAARSGTASCYLNNSGNISAPALILQGFPATPGEIFYFSGWVKVQDEINILTFKINFLDSVGGGNIQPVTEDPELLPGTTINSDPTYPGVETLGLVGSTISNGGSLSDDWIFVEVRGTVPDGADTVEFYCLNVPVDLGAVWVDDLFAYKLDGPSYVYPKQQITAVPNSGDIDVTWQSSVPRDYTVESSTDLDPLTAVWVDESGIVGGTGGELTFPVAGAAPASGERKFFRLQSEPIDRGIPANGNLTPVFDAGTPTMINWTGWAVFTPLSGPVEEGPYNTTEAPFTFLTTNTATFGINTLKNDGAPAYNGATAEVSVYKSFVAPENTDGARPFVNLRGKTITFRGTVDASVAYDSGNKGEVFIEFIGTNNEVVGYKALDINVDNPSTDYDKAYMNATTDGKFLMQAYVPENNLNYINVGFRNTGVVDSAGQMSILSSPQTLLIGSGSTIGSTLGPVPPASTNLVRNPLFADGNEGLDEWELYQSWENSTITPLSDGNVTASAGTVTFGVDSVDTGVASFQQNFFLPKNNAYAINTYNIYDKRITISGNAVASGYAAGNYAEIGIQVLNLGNSVDASTIWIADLTALDDINCDGTTYNPVTGAFSISTTVPALAASVNAVQFVFRNHVVTPGGGGQLDISNVSFVVEPVVNLVAATITGSTSAVAGVDEAYSVAITGSVPDANYVWEVFPGAGVTITGANSPAATINFASAGTYTVVATVCSAVAADGPSVTDSIEVTVP